LFRLKRTVTSTDSVVLVPAKHGLRSAASGVLRTSLVPYSEEGPKGSGKGAEEVHAHVPAPSGGDICRTPPGAEPVLTQIVKVDGSPGKHVWIDNQSTKITTAPPLQYQSQNVNIVPDSEGIYTFPTGFQGEFSDRLPFVECARTLTGSFSSDESAFTSNNQRNVYQSLPDIHNSVLESKPDTGNREELSTPVTITPLDTSLLLSTSNYLYGQMNEAPPALGVDRYTVEQNEDTNGLLINGIESSLGAVTNTETRLDFERSSNMHPYSFNNNSINTGQSGAGEDSANVTSSSPYTSLFWFDDPGQTATEQDYEDPSNSVQLFQPPHSEATQSEEHVTLAMDSFPQDALEEVYLACESRSEPLKAQQPFIQDTSTDAEISHNKRTDDITDAKRDRLTGKFKQNVAEHSSTTEKLCKVCNDRAVNHNFGQLTCESCKAFFRRNAHKVSCIFNSAL
uniref:Nuclear receptor domain-containing protein n=1 Tax=Echinostoma caproni TaxID=27848 RepID=A0A183A7T9_9TREM